MNCAQSSARRARLPIPVCPRNGTPQHHEGNRAVRRPSRTMRSRDQDRAPAPRVIAASIHPRPFGVAPHSARQGSYFPSFLEPRERSEQALVAVVQVAYVNGVSKRKVERLVGQVGTGWREPKRGVAPASRWTSTSLALPAINDARTLSDMTERDRAANSIESPVRLDFRPPTPRACSIREPRLPGCRAAP